MTRVFGPLWAAVLAASCLYGQSDVTAIRGARVIDGTGSPARSATVLIRGSRIESVSASAPIPAGARVIDANGQTLLPGIFDLHTHMYYKVVNRGMLTGDYGKILKAYLASGVTSVADFGPNGEQLAPIRDLLKTDEFVGPHVTLTPMLTTPDGHGTELGRPGLTLMDTPDQARLEMPKVLSFKPDAIKVLADGWRYGFSPNMTSMNVQTLTAVVEEAHKAGIKVSTHTVTLDGAKIAARAGVDIIVHGINDLPVDQELIGLMKAKGTSYVSTLAVYEPKHSPTPRALSVMEPAARDEILAAENRRNANRPVNRSSHWEVLKANVKTLYDAGIPIGDGTDAGVAGDIHGWATLREIELLTESGLTPLQALTAATGVSARALGVDKERGTIVEGKLADLVLVDGRPDQDIADVYKTQRVFVAGREFDPRVLEQAIQKDPLTPRPTHTIANLVADMERADGKTSLDTTVVYSTEAGMGHSTAVWTRIPREGSNHSLFVQAHMGASSEPFVRVKLPLTPGEVDLADASQFQGVSFDVRGDGRYRLLLENYEVRDDDWYAAPFSADGSWQTVRIAFSDLKRKTTSGPGWTPKDLREVSFEIARSPGGEGWLDLDNVRFY